MQISRELIEELQNRLKVGNRRGVHLNGVPGGSRYKFDLSRLRHINKNLPEDFISELLSNCPLKFRISWKDNIPDLNDLFEEEQTQLVKITRAFENLINQTQAIESEKGINTFGFGFPLIVRRDKIDKKITIAPLFIWSLNIKKLNEFNTWQVARNEDDAVYLNEVLINHLLSDSDIDIRDTLQEVLADGLLDRDELITVSERIINKINGTSKDYRESFAEKLKKLNEIPLKKEFETMPLTYNNAFIHFGGLFSIFEVQKQSVIKDYEHLKEFEGRVLNLEDIDNYDFQSISSVETDPTQQAVLNSLQNKRHLLIQGPPGTGKSQSLTAVLINALENGKKCIVVCEKRTALEVLEESLKKKGLNSLTILLKDLVKDRKNVVDSVRNRIEVKSEVKWGNRNVTTSRNNLQNTHKKIQELIDRINRRHNKLNQQLLDGKNWTYLVGEYLSNAKKSSETIKFDSGNFNYTSDELNRYLNKIENGSKLYFDYNEIKTLTFLNSKKLRGDNFFDIEDRVHKDFEEYSEIFNALTLLTKNFKIQFESNYVSKFNSLYDSFTQLQNNLNTIIEQFNTLKQELKNRYTNERTEWYQIQLKELVQLSTEVESILTRQLSNQNFTIERINSFGFKLLLPISKKKQKTKLDFDRFTYLIATISEKLNPLGKFKCNYIPTNIPSDALQKIADLKTCLNDINPKEISNGEFARLEIDSFLSSTLAIYKSHIASWSFDYKFKAKLLSELEVLAEKFNEIFNRGNEAAQTHPDMLEFNLKGSFQNKVDDIKMFVADLQEQKSKLKEIINNLLPELNLYDLNQQFKNEHSNNFALEINKLKTKIHEDGWINDKLIGLKNSQKDCRKIADMLLSSKEYFEHVDNPFMKEYKWFSFYNSLSRWEKELFDELKEINNWRSGFLKVYFDSLLKKNGDLDNLFTDDSDHERFNESTINLEQQQIEYILSKWQVIQDQNEKRFDRDNSINVVNLYNKKSSHRNQRLSLRNIVSKDIDLFTSYFPIILTTPEVCCSLFHNRDEYFDIVLFDEASQLRLEDNLPALLKGKQVIIAGDEHQMPPSNYFSKIFDGELTDESDDEDEDFRQDEFILSCESLLEFGQELNFEKRYLDFHYRSRHPFLIDFSNHAFYNGRLKPLPNTHVYNPISYVQVNGVYSDHSNESEAEMVLSIIEKNINRLPNGEYPTVGIATFNISQRNLIISKIRERQQLTHFNEFNAKMIELETSGFFVKNLENIQGDERDVIILSTTYGCDKDGKFTQRFGPINHTKGYKLLNVIITRAKYKVYVCTSVPENIIYSYNDYLVAEGSNNRRGVFFAYLAYAKAISEGKENLRKEVIENLRNNSSSQIEQSAEIFNLESPFEEEVYQFLIDKYVKERITTQVEYAGFRIDIVYTPGDSSKKPVAIECDGASYHSSREAYLYDHHRQKVLEQHGYVFHRIWSTNWWRNPKREAEKLFSFIDKHESKSEQNSTKVDSFVNAFTDSVEFKNLGFNPALSLDESIHFDTDQLEEMIVIEKEDDSTRVKVGCTIEVKYLNSDDILKIRITDGESKKVDSINYINIKTPLAVAILGKKEGDIVKIGALDKFVEILRIN